LFALGAGVPKSMSTAVDWWTKAANQGQYRAQAALANAYAREVFQEGTFLRQIVIDCRQGCEVPEDLVTAYYWAAEPMRERSIEATIWDPGR